MEVPKNFSFFGVKKFLPPGEYEGVVKEFVFAEKTSKLGNPYVTLGARVEVNSQTYIVYLSLDPNEKDKSLYRLIEQVSAQSGVTVEKLIELCQIPKDFFDLADGRKVKLISNGKGYLDIFDVSMSLAVPESF